VLNQEFSDAWYRFLHPEAGQDQMMSFTLGLEQVPFYARSKTNINLTRVDLIVEGPAGAQCNVEITCPGSAASTETMNPDPIYGGRQSMSKTGFPQQAQLLGNWQMKMKIKKTGAAGFGALLPEDLKSAYLVLGFKTS
jgi:hypothetical protein